jgi:hypothetical protein
MLKDELDCWQFAYDDSVDDYENQEESNSYNDLIIECKVPYVMPYHDMDVLMLTYYENQEIPWGASNVDDALIQHTNFAVWKDQLPKSYSGQLLARCCAVVEYFAQTGDFYGDFHELGRSIDVDLTDATTWWQLLRIMHYNALHLGVSFLTNTQVQEYGIDDRTYMYEKHLYNMPYKVWKYYRSCTDIMNRVYKTYIHPIEIVVYR